MFAESAVHARKVSHGLDPRLRSGKTESLPARQDAAVCEALRKRRKVEALFSELKNQIGLRRLRLRRIKFVREQFYLAAAAQNLKRLVRFLSLKPQPALANE